MLIPFNEFINRIGEPEIGRTLYDKNEMPIGQYQKYTKKIWGINKKIPIVNKNGKNQMVAPERTYIKL